MFSELDIINSKNWDNGNWIGFFQDRLGKMEDKRQQFDDLWDNFDNNVNAVSFYDNEGQLQVNIPLEKTLKEMYIGRTDGKVSYDIIADGQTNIEQLQPAKYSLMFFLDGNGKDNFWKENKSFRDNKSHYGSGIRYTGIRKYSDYRYSVKEGVEVQGNEDLLNENNFDEIENITWFFHPKNIHPRDFYVDDNNYGNPDIQEAADCIFKEKLTATELKLRYGNNKIFNIESVGYYLDPQPKNENDEGVSNNQIIIYHYFHRITKTYLIVANRNHTVYRGKYLYNDGKLPFDNVQHYTNENRFRGEGIPERVSYLKAYKSEIFQDILAGAAMSSGVNLIVGNDDEIGQDWTVGGRSINLWRTTGGADRVQPINTSPNLGFFTTVLDLLEKQVIIDTGINPLEQIDPLSDKVGIVEIMEANKAIRNKSVDENYNIGLDNVLTMTLSRIQQFAPSLLSEKIKDSNGEIIKTEFPSIKIENYKVERKKGQYIITEDIGKIGYFKLEPGVVQGIGVKVVTSSTNNILPIIEKQKVTEYINNLVSLFNIAQTDQTGEMMKKLSEYTRFEQLLGWMSDAYGYDINGLKANTEKDKIAQENLEKIEGLKEILKLNTIQNVGQNNGVAMQGETQNIEGGQQQATSPMGKTPTGLQ